MPTPVPNPNEIEKNFLLETATKKIVELNVDEHVKAWKKEKQMILATQFVLDLLACRKISDKYEWLSENQIRSEIACFHYQNRPLMNNKKSMIDEIQKLNPNKIYPYQSGVTFINFKLKADLDEILDIFLTNVILKGSRGRKGPFYI